MSILKCYSCGNYYSEDDINIYERQYHCKKCGFYCDGCDNWAIGTLYKVNISRDLTINICESCAESGKYVCCYNCGEFIPTDSALYVNDIDIYACEDCFGYGDFFKCRECGGILDYVGEMAEYDLCLECAYGTC